MESAGIATAKAKLVPFGQNISVAILNEVQSIYAPFARSANNARVAVTRDVPYGDHERHRLNVFAPAAGESAGDVIMFVHGGGFVSGDKEEVAEIYYDNVGYWAANHGFTGVVINYRLAPAYPWPAGADDVADAVAWVSNSMGGSLGDPRVFVLGHSAGASHVASYLVRCDHYHGTFPRPTGCILLSGIYDLRLRPVNMNYFGEDETLYEHRSPAMGLVKTGIPILIAVAEHDPEFIQRHAMSVLAGRLDDRKSLPPFVQIPGHNHFSTIMHLNSPDTSLSEKLLSFVRGIAR